MNIEWSLTRGLTCRKALLRIKFWFQLWFNFSNKNLLIPEHLQLEYWIFLATNSAHQIWQKSRIVFLPFIFLKVFIFIDKFIQNLSPIFTCTSGTGQVSWWVQEEIFWFLSSSLCEGRLQQIQQISIQALGLSSDDFVEEKMIHALQTNRPQSC